MSKIRSKFLFENAISSPAPQPFFSKDFRVWNSRVVGRGPSCCRSDTTAPTSTAANVAATDTPLYCCFCYHQVAAAFTAVTAVFDAAVTAAVTAFTVFDAAVTVAVTVVAAVNSCCYCCCRSKQLLLLLIQLCVFDTATVTRNLLLQLLLQLLLLLLQQLLLLLSLQLLMLIIPGIRPASIDSST